VGAVQHNPVARLCCTAPTSQAVNERGIDLEAGARSDGT
jgi:hypothetical protein